MGRSSRDIDRTGQLRLRALLAGALLFVVACGGSDGTSRAEPSGDNAPTGPAEDAQAGGSLTVLREGDARGFDPARDLPSILTASGMSVAIFDTLLYSYAAQDDGIPQEPLALSMTTEDAITWTMELRPDVEFSDGTPFDAEAVRFNFERHADPNLSSPARELAEQIASMEVVDDLTLEIVLSQPNSLFDEGIADGPMTFVGSPAAIEELGDGFTDAPVGAGPFVITDRVRDSHVVMERNPNYWDAPRPYLDEITFRVIPDSDQRFNTFSTSTGAHVSNLANPQQAEQAEGAGAHVLTSQPDGAVIIVMNLTRPPFDDVRVRQAFAHAIDYQRHAEVARAGQAQPLTHMFAETSPFFDPALELPGYDPDRAQDLMDEVMADSGPVNFTLVCAQNFRSSCEFFQAMVAEIDGMPMDLEFLAPSEVVPRQRTGDFEASTAGLGSLPEPHLAAQYTTGGIRNVGGYSNPDVDEAFAAGRATTSEEEQVEAYRTVQELLIADVPLIYFQGRDLLIDLVSPDVRDFTSHNGYNAPSWGHVWLEQ